MFDRDLRRCLTAPITTRIESRTSTEEQTIVKLELSRRRLIHMGAAGLLPTLLSAGCANTAIDAVGALDTQVTGPISGGDKGWIYRSPVLDLDALGYVMEEFFVSGTARSFKLADGAETSFDGEWRTEPDLASPFTTRIFILRPADPAKYNGVLLAHWQNVSAGYENGYPTGDEIFKGYAWMGVSAQADGIYGTPRTRPYSLKEWDSARYGELNHPGDAFSYDIYAKSVSAALARSAKARGGSLANLKTKSVIAMGGSQSAWRLATYINAVHPHQKIFNGFLLLSHFGVAMPLSEPSIPQLLGPAGNGRSGGSCQIRATSDAPVLAIGSQAEALTRFPARQPDTDTFRSWEVAGAPHAPPSTMAMKNLTLERDGIPLPGGADQNIVEWGYVVDAGIRKLAKWIDTGEAPPQFPPISIVLKDGRPTFETDAAQNVLGGIRPPEVAAPVGVHTAALTKLLGHSELFGEPRMLELHGSRERFLASWNEAVDVLVRADLLEPEQEGPIRAHASDFWK
ncbi:MAG: alpha/beta hydrolase domain-containing protein [Hyphomonadaceae bacterium]